MKHVVIPKDRINNLVSELIKLYRVAAPVKEGKILEFKEIQCAEQACLTDEITYKSPKEFLFPQVEKILNFDGDGKVSGEENEEEQSRKRVLLGVRPCDLEAIKVLTAVFTKGRFIDTFFEKHRMNTVIIGLGCIEEKPGCFCSERGINKDYSRECDVFLKDMGDHYLVEIITDEGKELIEKYLESYAEGSGTSFEDVDKNEGKYENNSEVIKNSSSLNDTILNEQPDKKLLEINKDENILFNNFDWDRVSETCIGCGTCTYICPTCHCFDFKDVFYKGTASRFRRWDSCMYPKFTIHASGHNPRPSKKERFRQRVMHKYVYIKKNFGYTACTGCGRCIRSCPAGVNIKTVVKKIMEELV